MKNQKEIIKGESKKINSKESKKIDEINIDKSIKDSSNQFKSDLYISYNGSPSKSQRSKLRNQLSGYMKRIIKFNESKDQVKRNEEIERFKEFYKENYKNNDYSIRSLYYGSSNSSQYEMIGDFLSQLKRLKSIDLEIK